MSRPLTAVLLIAALSAPALAQARQTSDGEMSARLAAAYQGGLDNPEPAETAKDQGLCASAWGAVWRVYHEHAGYRPPSSLSAEDIEWQAESWDDLADKAGEDGQRAMQAADEALFNPWFAAGDYERMMEFAGSCGTID